MRVTRSCEARLRSAKQRAGKTQPIIVGLLVAILLAIIVLIVTIASSDSPGNTNSSSGSSNAVAVAEGQKVTRTHFDNPPELVRNETRFRETARQGRTYTSHVRAGFTCRVEDKDWGVSQVVNTVFESEFVVRRTIEVNDGNRIVELREFKTVRSAKLLTEADVTFSIGQPNPLLLSSLDYIQPGLGEVALTVSQVRSWIEEVASGVVNTAAKVETAKAVAKAESLEGKIVRLCYENGRGVVSVEAVKGSLSQEERDLVEETSVLFDYFMLPEKEIAVGETWPVKARHFGVLFDPSWKGTPAGTVTVVRGENRVVDGRRIASLNIDSGSIELNASDKSQHRVGTFTPSGNMEFALDEGYVQAANLAGELNVEQVSRDHVLFEAVFRFRPRLHVSYICDME